MAKTTTLTIHYRRKREGRTDYRKRLRLLQAGKPRLVARKSLKNMLVQIIEYDAEGDKVLAMANSPELKQYGWGYSCGSIPGAYLTGFLAGKKAVDGGIKEAVFDLGLQSAVAKSRLYSMLKGVIDAGLNVPASPEIFPPEDRIKGMHISKYAGQLKGKEGKQFSAYSKNGLKAEDMPKVFDSVKKNIQAGSKSKPAKADK
jgi:large subunit ribosomal protein L18